MSQLPINSIQIMESVTELERCFNLFKELRPHLVDKEEFVNKVILQQKQGYQIVAYIVDGIAVAGIGYRLLDTLAWGKILYIDDLVTGIAYRGHKYGKCLLEYVIDYARQLNCDQVHLDTGYQRHDAHKVYLNCGFKFISHHLAHILV